MRRFNIAAVRLIPEAEAGPLQLDLFSGQQADPERERSMQKALLHIRDRYGKNAIVKGLNLREGATAIERNGQIGGHRE